MLNIMTNTLLNNDRLSAFSKISPADIEPALDHVLEQAKQTVTDLLATLTEPTWDSLVLPMEDMDANIDRVWSPVSHLNSVMNSDELRLTMHAYLS